MFARQRKMRGNSSPSSVGDDDLIDLVWDAMRDNEVYTPRDLANRLDEPVFAIVRVLGFLTRFGFAERVTGQELIFRKVSSAPAPGDALEILTMLLEQPSESDARSVARLPRPKSQLNLP
jgi:hypothetical protein